MRQTKLITTHTNGNNTRFHITPLIDFPDKLHLSGYMTNGGTAGTPLIITVRGIKASSEAMVLSTTEGAAKNGSAVIVVSEPSSCKWQHSYPHALGQFTSDKLHAIDVEITDASTGQPAAYSPPGGVTNIVVLEFTISHRDHRFNTQELTTYKPDMYSAIN